jgi:hypothetical protein
MDFLVVFLDLLFHCLEPAVAGHARNQQRTIALFGDGKISSSQFDGELLIGAMCRARTATGPIVQLMELDIEKFRDAPDRIIILPRGSMKGASRIIRNFFHLLAPLSKVLKIS